MIECEYSFHGMHFRDHRFEVPLNYDNPNGEKISVFGREISDSAKKDQDLPWLIYFEGGPGFGGPRPHHKAGWVGKILEKYRLFSLDQRGTGISTTVNYQSLARFETPQEQADYLANFRVDNIINDAEFIRKELVGDDKWSTLGQSFGGFCIMRYLSAYPNALKEAFITGGVPSVERHVDDVYRETYKFCQDKTEIYYDRYPQDVAKVKEIAEYLQNNEVYLPCGDLFTTRRLQLLGMALGMANGNENLHYLFEKAFIQGANGKELSHAFLRGIENALSFDYAPIFSVLHEAIYAQEFATNWSAERLRSEYPQFDDFSEKVLFVGEMIGPWMFDEFTALKPLKEAAEILAQKSDWPKLYDLDVLKQNKVPVACAVYFNDMYVNHLYSNETVKTVPNMKAWVTSEYEHCGLAASGTRVIERLQQINDGNVAR